jgi:hypothetical protein
MKRHDAALVDICMAIDHVNHLLDSLVSNLSGVSNLALGAGIPDHLSTL